MLEEDIKSGEWPSAWKKTSEQRERGGIEVEKNARGGVDVKTGQCLNKQIKGNTMIHQRNIEKTDKLCFQLWPT